MVGLFLRGGSIFLFRVYFWWGGFFFLQVGLFFGWWVYFSNRIYVWERIYVSKFQPGMLLGSGSMFRNFYRAHVLEMDFFGGRNLNVARSGRRSPLQQHRREASKECIEE